MSETVLPNKNAATGYREARQRAEESLRDSVVGAAARLLVAEGPDALTVRRVAEELGCSTKVLYTLFNGKDGLANALYRAGCTRLGEAIGAVSPQGSRAGEYLGAVADAYGRFAVEHPAFYGIMFCGAIPGFRPDAGSVGTTLSAFESVRDAAAAFAAAGETDFAPEGAAQAVKALWAALHGVLSLHLLGHFDGEDEARRLYDRTAAAVIASLLAVRS